MASKSGYNLLEVPTSVFPHLESTSSVLAVAPNMIPPFIWWKIWKSPKFSKNICKPLSPFLSSMTVKSQQKTWKFCFSFSSNNLKHSRSYGLFISHSVGPQFHLLYTISHFWQNVDCCSCLLLFSASFQPLHHHLSHFSLYWAVQSVELPQKCLWAMHRTVATVAITLGLSAYQQDILPTLTLSDFARLRKFLAPLDLGTQTVCHDPSRGHKQLEGGGSTHSLKSWSSFQRQDINIIHPCFICQAYSRITRAKSRGHLEWLSLWAISQK